MSEDRDAILQKIRKLLDLSAKNPNEHEAAAAAAKAQELALQHNLDISLAEREGGRDGRREDELVGGGFYQWQQELWGAVARLNFCLYWSQKFRRPNGVDSKGRRALYGRRHRLVGRSVNVQTTKFMAGYLEAVADRLTRDRFPGRKLDNHSMSYREGVAYRLRQRLDARRYELLAKEREENDRRRNEAERAGVSFSTALVISTLAKAEEDANKDFVYGEGYSARQMKVRAEAAQERRENEKAYVAWAAAHPEEARKKEEKQRKVEEREERSASRRRFGRVDDYAFWQGAEAAEGVSLDPQAEGRQTKKIGRGS